MVGILLLTFVTIRLLFRSWEKIVVRRSSLLANASDYSALTVLVRTAGHLAKKPTTAAEARALWGLLYPGQIFDVRMVRDTGALPKQLAQRKKLTAAIEALEAKIAKAKAKPKPTLTLTRTLTLTLPLTLTLKRTLTRPRPRSKRSSRSRARRRRRQVQRRPG